MKTFASDSLVVTISNTTVHLSNYIIVAGVAAFFGAIWQTDALFLALSLPIFFISAIVNAVGSVFIPVFADSRNTDPQLIGSVFLLYAFISALLIVLIIMFIALYLFRGIPFENVTTEFQQLVIEQTLWMSPVVMIQVLVSKNFNGSDFLNLIVAGFASCITYLAVSFLLQSEQLKIILEFFNNPSLENISLER